MVGVANEHAIDGGDEDIGVENTVSRPTDQLEECCCCCWKELEPGMNSNPVRLVYSKSCSLCNIMSACGTQ